VPSGLLPAIVSTWQVIYLKHIIHDVQIDIISAFQLLDLDRYLCIDLSELNCLLLVRQ
jgi:hypothetical protein